jgi:hypothetical protein
MKTCDSCKILQPDSNFNQNRAKCKGCRNIYFKNNYRLKHPKKPRKVKIDRTAYYKSCYLYNKSSINAKNRQYYHDNKEKIIKNCLKYKKNKLKNDINFQLRNLRPYSSKQNIIYGNRN